MKQKYLTYTLFALLAANMSWSFIGSNERGHIQLASEGYEYEIEPGKKITITEGNDSTKKVIDANGNKTDKVTRTVKIEKVEGNVCDCLIGTTLQIDVNSQGSLDLSKIKGDMEKIEAKAKEEAQQAKEKNEITKKEREERKKQEENCRFSDVTETLECHQDRLQEVAEELQSDCRRNSTDREQAKRCRDLEAQYSKHKDAIISHAENLQETIIQAKGSNDRELAREARLAQQELSNLKKSSSIVNKTINSLLAVQNDFAQREQTYNYIESLIYTAAQTQNPIYGMEAKRLQDQLKNYMQYYNPQQSLVKQLDTTYRGGLDETHISSFMQRNDNLRQALGLNTIYPGQQSIATNGQFNPHYTRFDQAFTTQGAGIPGASVAIPGNNPTTLVNGQFNGMPQSQIYQSSQTSVPTVGNRIYVRQ